MTYLLDTNVCIDLLKRPNGTAATKIATCDPKDLAVCSVVLGELFVGAMKSPFQQHNTGLIQQLTSQFKSFPFDDVAALCFGQIREYLERTGQPIGPYDLQIAAIAITNNLVLVTHNTREFGRVPNLTIEDWLLP